MIRLAAFDLDGTLMGRDSVIAPRVRRAIAAAQARGVIITIATGRMYSFMRPIARDLGLTAPLICHQGGLIQAADADAPIYRATMEPALVRDVLAWQARTQARLALYADDAVFLAERQRSEEFYRYMLGEQLFWVDDFHTVLEQHELIKFVLVVEPHEAEQVRDELQRYFGERLSVTRSHELIVEGNPPGVTKGVALEWLAGYLGIPREQVMAVGDHDNDIPMLAWAGLGVAMGNATPAAKAIADWIAPPLEEDGAAVALERMGEWARRRGGEEVGKAR